MVDQLMIWSGPETLVEELHYYYFVLEERFECSAWNNSISEANTPPRIQVQSFGLTKLLEEV